MKQIKRVFCLVFALCIVASQFSTSVFAANYFTTTPTGYKSASDVNYVRAGSYIANWGARGEVATFLSTYAQSFYNGSCSQAAMFNMQGGTSQSTAPSSELYRELKSYLTGKQTRQTSYDDNKSLMKYTDCISGDYSKISAFYSGKLVGSSWVSGGKTWNREHTWPNSKGDASGNGENDIMMLRPEDPSNNSSRGNKAYGEGTEFYNPSGLGADVRGDCARILLYVYTRWGNTGRMWGSSGVIESLDVLLKWMQIDPVDTWEMGRNDAVQSITGTRNVFVDYPELAFKLFGREIPKTMSTPSGMAANIGTGNGNIGGGNTGNNNNDNTGNGGDTNNGQQGGQQTGNTCTHERTEIRGAIAATCSKNGNTGNVVCETCGVILEKGKETAKTAHYSNDGDDKCDVCFAKMSCIHKDVDTANKKDATCTEPGYTGDEVCASCGQVVRYGVATEKLGDHVYGEWTVITPAVGNQNGLKSKTCAGCGDSIVEIIPASGSASEGPSTLVIVLIIVGGVLVLGGATVATILIIKKKKK